MISSAYNSGPVNNGGYTQDNSKQSRSWVLEKKEQSSWWNNSKSQNEHMNGRYKHRIIPNLG